jgi:penicillin G amidase
MRWIRRGLVALLLLGLLAALVLALYAWRSLPQTSGTLSLPGARGEIRIERDAHGIPTIVAGSLLDACYGLGVAHAQDRLWQLETHRRIASGSAAAPNASAVLPTDRFLRALGVRRAAAAQWERATPATKAALQAYADGVNAVVAQGGQARAPEFLVLGLQPGRWEGVDSLAWMIMMAWDLGGNWNNELLRLRLALKLPTVQVEQLLPPYPGSASPVSLDYAALYRSLGLSLDKVAALTQGFDAAPESGIEGVGSNNWVLAGSRTSTGSPLLANDPHLKLTSPALWYFARIKAPGLDVAGATMPGVPFVVLGQNEHIAWGFTNTGPDVQDLYLEQLDPADRNRVRTPAGFEPLETRTEVIKVKGQPDVTMTVRRSRHGPVISDAGTMADLIGTRAGHLLALRWTALDADADPVATGLALQSATSLDAAFGAVQPLVAPMQSIVMAERGGAIGLIAPGRVPQRSPEHDLKGHVPAPGWDARYDWIGYVPAAQTPRLRDPASGWIATANQRIVGPDYPHHLTYDWALPFRQQRIEQLLESRPKHSLAQLQAMHLDDTSLAAQRLLPVLLKTTSSHPLAAAAQAQLEGFQGRMQAERAAPLIFWAWQRQLARALFADDVGEPFYDEFLAGRNFQEALEQVLARDDSRWCDDRRTPAVESCVQQSSGALGLALDELSARFGGQPAAWRWGDAHEVRAEHRPFSRVAGLDHLFELRVPMAGDTHTVSATQVGLRRDARTGAQYHVAHSASLRAVYDLADRSKSGVVHSSGQSGNVFSPRYRNFLGPWARGELLPLWPQGAPESVLVVKPAP